MASANFIGILNLQVREVHSENRGYDLTGKETFVKVELANTNGIPNKKRTKAVTSSGVSTLFFDHMRFEVQDTDTELLIKLCVKKNKVKPAVVVSGGGIFIKDIIGARNYEKWFKLFTPTGSAQGGYVRLTLDFERAALGGAPSSPLPNYLPFSEVPQSPQMNPSPAINFGPSMPSSPMLPYNTMQGATPRAMQNYGLRPQVRIDDEDDVYADEKDFGRRRRNPLVSFLKFAVGLGFVGYAAGSFYEMQRKQAARERVRNRYKMGY